MMGALPGELSSEVELLNIIRGLGGGCVRRVKETHWCSRGVPSECCIAQTGTSVV